MDFRAAAPLFPPEFEVAAQPVNTNMAATEHTSIVLIGFVILSPIGGHLAVEGAMQSGLLIFAVECVSRNGSTVTAGNTSLQSSAERFDAATLDGVFQLL